MKSIASGIWYEAKQMESSLITTLAPVANTLIARLSSGEKLKSQKQVFCELEAEAVSRFKTPPGIEVKELKSSISGKYHRERR